MNEDPHLTFDINTPGLSTGHLVVPAGNDFETLAIPVVSLNKGDGPRILITGANHGNELEGPLVARRLMAWLPEAQTCGRIVIVPVLNPPAVRGSSRNTPIDGLNLNRTFPGRPDGSISERISDALCRVLVTEADIVFDLHSMGPPFISVPMVITHPISDPDLMAKTLRLGQSMKMPITLLWEHNETAGMFDSWVHGQGKIFICTEFGGGVLTLEDLNIYEAGVRNGLINLGVIDGKPEVPPYRQQKACQTLETLLVDKVASPLPGIFEPACSVLQIVQQGDIIGKVHPVDSVSSESLIIRSPSEGTICTIRTGSFVAEDQDLAIIARPVAT
ncbi:succinylglutamate desuccinylase/aspartoacylase family protein [Mesorhizobium atlanticum]|uniref:Peptidase M14 n=1 Tax=Mesorhizobium atlanticum TaxID=2233532 RepID=A0A330GER5_9HYPH|nr:succinylglutamate desuccinylase/aspartoacylase family protein [Mesorhizobium atlanticum]RAZ71149.1 peptidase M14 [Mesorhizobium atlanticum]